MWKLLLAFTCTQPRPVFEQGSSLPSHIPKAKEAAEINTQLRLLMLSVGVCSAKHVVKVHPAEEEARNIPCAPGYQQTGGHIIKKIFSGLHSSIIVPYVAAASPPIPFSNTLVSLTF